jgi:hypothetical protein
MEYMYYLYIHYTVYVYPFIVLLMIFYYLCWYIFYTLSLILIFSSYYFLLSLIEAQLIGTIINSFSGNKDVSGKITKADFFDFIGNLSIFIEDDSEFEEMIKRSVYVIQSHTHSYNTQTLSSTTHIYRNIYILHTYIHT